MDAARSGVPTYGIPLTILADRSLLRDDLPTFRVSFSVFILFFPKGVSYGYDHPWSTRTAGLYQGRAGDCLAYRVDWFRVAGGVCAKDRIADVSSTCTNNLKQIGLGVQNYQSTFGRMPPLYGGSNGDTVQNSRKSSNVWGSTHLFLLPYIEQDNLFKTMGNSSTPPIYDATTNGGPANCKSCHHLRLPAWIPA